MKARNDSMDMGVVDQSQEQKAKHVVELLLEAVTKARDAHLFGEVTITVNMQNGRIGHYEKTVRETYK